ncbi:hypothetical protein ACP6PL_01970 [Dapis sp. BLCC M126]|uniref:hypothetical protein n=1 Tax=Dapis sp. BLCC M126 TaxID=3400189 RepID=UPI003CF64A18
MKIEIIGWEAEGLRCPDMNINLLFGVNPAHVSLIQMPNGTAKTTTLSLIRAAMNGEADKWDAEKVKSFRRANKFNYRGKFVLDLRVDEKRLTFELDFDFEEGKVDYSTSDSSLGGITPKWEPPLNLYRFFNQKFVQLFIFDGEFAKDLLDSNKTHASQAIDSLFQLYLLDEIKGFIDKDWNQKTEKKASDQRGLTRQRNKVNGLRERIKKVEAIKDRKQEELNVIERDIQNLETKIDESNSQNQDLYQQLTENREEKGKAENKVENRTRDIMTQIRQPQFLHKSFIDSLIELKDKLDKAKLPEKASRQFFIDLLEEDKCICGIELNHQTREAIQSRAELYLSDYTAAFLNSLKEDIRTKLTPETSENFDLLTKNLEDLKTDIEIRQYAETRCRAIESQLTAQGDTQLKSWQTLLDQKKIEKNDIERLLEQINRTPNHKDDPKNYEKTLCIESLKKWLEVEEEKLAEISHTVELTKKKQILQKIIDESLKKAKIKLTDSLIEDCNLFLDIVLERDPIHIDKIENSLYLKSQKEASMGQTLSVGYTFLMTLLHKGKHDFPLVVDSPANAIDATVRREIAKQIPQLCHQFIALTISTEREGFTDTLDNKSDSTKFITVFRKTRGTEKLQNTLPSEGVTQTENCVVVEGKEYFNKFDLEEDEDET